MHTILDLVFDWLVFGFGVPILIGTGFTLLADEFRQFRAARVCFTVAAVWLFGKVAMWGILTSEKFSIRAGVTALVCAIVGVGLVEAIRLTANREAEVRRIESTQASAPTVPPVVAPDTREFTNRTPRELLAFYKNVTTLQGDSLIAPFKGLWIKVAGKVESVVDAGGGRAQVVLKDHEGVTCTCTFQPRWTDALKRLSKNDEISVTGKIFESQIGTTLYLAECDLEGQSSASAGIETTSTSPALPPLATFKSAGKDVEQRNAKSSETLKAPDLRPPTLLDLFTQDFPNTMKVTDEISLQRAQDSSTVRVKRQLYVDFAAKTEFVGFFIPSSDPFSEKSFHICQTLVEGVRPFMDDLLKKIDVGGGYKGEMTTLSELVFSGRVFLYHEGFLSIPQKADIIRIYKAKNYDVQFRGPDYLGDQVIAWHQKHDQMKPKQR